MTESASKIPHAAVMDELKHKLDLIRDVIPLSRPVVFLDYPMHGNVGDLLIHAGTDRFFAVNGYEVIGRFSIHEFCLTHRPDRPIAYFKESVRRLDALVRRGVTIVFQGGGNLGDLYRDHQMFRELVIARYPETPIVILPQSIHFQAPESRAATARIFAAHRQLYVFARDRESLGYLREECGNPASLMPDMAHALWGSLPRQDGSKTGTLHFRRRDKEAKLNAEEPVESFDWDDVTSAVDRGMIRLLRKMQSLDLPTRHVVANHVLWNSYRDRLLRRSVARVGQYCRLVTDRLHGMILGALLDMPVICEDNSYGKLGRYYSEWFKASDRIEHREQRKTPPAPSVSRSPESEMGALREYGV
ncbi:hypothetical protein G5V57_19655 [Nordella sp. HKS 07]|uniref:polysaccharide pyruvyl transferase family protein n=1 Tax=Nordella sp. HKS 07 TaxID=2712222 RepID=UPI0013E1EFBC|nr:polysaccharide pyruvyl transferase family protein [Nordella sp. HKS 07]QIG49738.1 hypothetical protein G5V57_19655 [Nordella sp. HKS 07]